MVLAVVKAPAWLVVEGEASKADIAVILGGGGGSRLSKGLSLSGSSSNNAKTMASNLSRDGCIEIICLAVSISCFAFALSFHS